MLSKVLTKALNLSLIISVLLSSNVEAALYFVTEENAVNSDNFILDFDDSSTDFIDFEFGASLGSKISYDILNTKFIFNQDLDLQGNEAINTRLENRAGAPTCDATALGRIYYDDVLNSSYVCEEITPGVYGWVDLTIASSASNTKVVTVGTGGNYSTLGAAATYLNGLTGGMILLTPETHLVTTTVDLQNIIVVGSNPEQSILDVNGVGVLQVKDTILRNLTIDVDAALTASSAMDVKYAATTTSSVVFDWVDVITGGTKTLLGSTAGTPPTLISRFVSPSAKSGTASIVPPKASSGLNTVTSAFAFSSQGGNGALNINDWDVSIAGSSYVLTTGTITTTPNETIFVYPGMNLQEAINSLPTGGVVTLLPGIHGITNPLFINNDNITLSGYGDASIIEATGFAVIDATTAAINFGTVDGTAPVSDVTLKDFKLEVNNTDIHGIRASGGTDLKTFNVTVEKTAGTSGSGATAKLGILLMDGNATPLIRPVIKNSRVFGAVGRWFTDGIHVSGEGATAGLFGNGNGVQNALVESSSVDFVGETAAAFVHVSDSSLFNNRFSQMGGAGGGAYGIYMGRINRTNMANNIVSGSLSTTSIALGIESFNIGADPTTENSIFSGNVIDGTANGGVGFGTGLQIGAVGGPSVNNNIFKLNSILGASTATTEAVVIRGNFDKNNFGDNTISGGINAWNAGINLQNIEADENTLENNIFTNVTTAITDSGTNTKFGISQHPATVDPTVNNDVDEGYIVGTVWVNTNANTSFISVDDTSGAAVWNQIDGGGVAGHTQNTDTGTTIETFTIDNDDTGGDLALVFGQTLNERLTWNDINSRFDLSDALNIFEDLTVGADTETIDSDGGAFSLNGNDVFIADSLGVEGAIYTDDTAIKYEFLDISGCILGSATAGTISGGRSPVVRFDGIDSSQMRCATITPDDWVAGTDINYEIFWSPSDATTGDLFLEFDRASFGVGDDVTTVFTNTDLPTQTVNITTQSQIYSTTAIIPAADIAAGELQNFRFRRTPADVSDTYVGDINIHMIRLDYTGKKLH